MNKNTVEIILSARDKASQVTQRAFSTIQNTSSRAMETVKVASVAAAGALVTLSGVISKVGISYNAMVEQSEVAWKTLLGTQAEAKKMLEDIATFAKNTPFETQDVDLMAKYMHNAGLAGKDLFNELTKVSDVAGAFAIPAAEAKEMTRQMSQVRQAGLAYTEDLNILQDRGVPIYKAIAEQIKGNVADVKKMASDGKLSADIYIAAFNKIAKGVEGASAAQSKTYNGMISTLKDNTQMLFAQVMEPTFNRIKEALPKVIGTVEKLNDSFAKGGWSQIMKDFLPPSVVSAIEKGFETIGNAIDSFKDKLDIVYNLQSKIEEQDWKGIGTGVAAGILAALEAVGEFGPKFANWVFEQLARINWLELGERVAKPALEFVVGFLKTLLDPSFWLQNWQTVLTGALIVLPIGKLLKIPGVKQVADWVWGVIKPAGKQVLEWGTKLFGDMGGSFMSGLTKALGLEGARFLPKLKEIVGNGIDKLKDFGQTIYVKGLYLMEKLGGGIANAGPKQVVGAFKSLIGLIDNVLTGFFKKAGVLGVKIIEFFAASIRVTYRVAIDPFVEMGIAIGKVLLSLGTKAYQWGKDVVVGLAKGLGEATGKAVQKAKEVAEGVSKAVKNFFGIKSPSRLMKLYGQFVGEGLIQGLEDKRSAAQKKAEEISEKVREGLERYISDIDRFADQVMDALRKKYEKQERIQTQAIDREIELARKATDKKIKLYDDEYAAKLKTLDAEEAAKLIALQKQIDAINEQTDAEDKALREQEYQKRIGELQKKLLEEESATERAKIAEQLNEEIARHERDQLLESRRQKIETLREEMELIRDQADQKREQLRIEYENKKAHEESLFQLKLTKFEQEKTALSAHFANLTTEEALQAEARKLFLNKDQKEIIALLNTYAPGWQDAGRSFGEKLVEGLNSQKENVKSAVNEMLSMVQRAKEAEAALNSSSSGSSSSSKSSGSKIYTVKNGDTLSEIADKYNTTASALAKANGISNVNLIRAGQSLKIPGLYKGGNVLTEGSVLVGERGPEVLKLPKGAQVSPLGHSQEPTIHIDQIIIPVKDLEEIKSVKDLFMYLKQTSRAMGSVY